MIALSLHVGPLWQASGCLLHKCKTEAKFRLLCHMTGNASKPVINSFEIGLLLLNIDAWSWIYFRLKYWSFYNKILKELSFN